MSISIAETRQIENEMIFRRMNEQVGDDLGALDAMHIEDNDIYLIRDDALLLSFKCECSDENCDQRIALKLSDYQAIHTDRDTFVLVPNHEVESIETIILSTDEYIVVQKNNSTAEPGNHLNETSIDNGSASSS